MKIRIRKAKEKDLKRIYEIEKRSYPPELQAPHKILKYRFKTFGIWVAEIDGKTVGFFTCVPVKLSCSTPDIGKILKNRNPYYKPWFDEYKKRGKFNTLYICSTAVETRYQNRGLGKAMIKYSLKLAKNLGLSYRASVLRMPGYRAYYKRTKESAQKYIEKVIKEGARDRFLTFYLKLGFKLGKVISNYEPDRSSLDCGVFAFKLIQ